MVEGEQSSGLADDQRLIYISVMSVTMLITCFANFLALFTFITARNVRSVNNLFYINLAICDLLVGVTTGSATITSLIFNNWIFGDIMCDVCAFMDSTLIVTGTWTLMSSSVDRCIALYKPLWHRSNVTKPVVKKCILLVWFIGFAVSSPPLVGWNDYQYSHQSFNCGMTGGARYYFLILLITSLFIPVTVVIICYTIILRIALPSLINRQKMTTHHTSKRNNMNYETSSKSTEGIHEEQTEVDSKDRNIQLQQTKIKIRTSGSSRHSSDKISKDPGQLVSNTKTSMNNVCPKISQPTNQPLQLKLTKCASQQKYRSNIRIRSIHCAIKPAFRTLVIVGVFFVCTVPAFVIGFIYWVDPEATIVTEMMSHIIHWMVFLNSALNPVVYGMLDKKVRTVYFHVLCFCCAKIRKGK